MFKGRKRVLLCFLILSIWIFMIIAGMYKYMGVEMMHSGNSFLFTDNSRTNMVRSKYLNEIFKSCTDFSDIVAKSEGGRYEDFILKGVIVLSRHGDRGPLSYVHGIESVDCGVKDPLLTIYMEFLTNWTHTLWPQPGAFHSFPLLPSSITSCQLGQLTFKGITQHLKLGKVLNDVYGKVLFSSNSNEIKGSTFTADDILVVSTKYRRTFQSAMALMFNIVPNHVWTHLNVKESLSISFCFIDCACPSSDYYKKLLALELKKNFQNQPHMQKIVKLLSYTLIDSKDASVSDLRDALLSFLCHKASLPCKNFVQSNWNNLRMSHQRSLQTMDPKLSNYIINIDQDDKPKGVEAYDDLTDVYNNSYENDDTEKCINPEHVSMLFSYLYEDKKRQLQSLNNNIISILKAYGLIKNIVQKMLAIVSNNKPKLIVYSGHDKTLQYLATALGFGDDILFVPYASRIIFETYLRRQSNVDIYSDVLPKEYYFRILYNGEDVTKKLIFCRGDKSTMNRRQDSKGQSRESYFCPIEYIVRYIHDDYFVSLNSTNYKDACMGHS